MNQGLRKAFRVFTILLLAVSIGTAYENVFSDDTAVRASANDLARKHAGCGDTCRVTNIDGSRGMFDEHIEYDVDGPASSPGSSRAGHYVVTCRRAWVVAGDYGCTVADGK